MNSGKVAITWRATDLHLAPRSVALFWRPDQPGAAWQPLAEGQENTGRFIWAVPATVPTAVSHPGRGGGHGRPPRIRPRRPKPARSWSIAAGRAAGSSAWTPTPAPAPGHRLAASLIPQTGQRTSKRRPEEFLDGVALGDQLGGGGVEPLAGLVVDRQTGHDRAGRVPLGDEREAVDQAGRDAVAAIGDDRRAEPVAWRGGQMRSSGRCR